MPTTTRLCWLDLREAPSKNAIIEEALHHGVDGIVAAAAVDLENLPPTVDRVLLREQPITPEPDLGVADVVIAPMTSEQRRDLGAAHPAGGSASTSTSQTPRPSKTHAVLRVPRTSPSSGSAIPRRSRWRSCSPPPPDPPDR